MSADVVGGEYLFQYQSGTIRVPSADIVCWAGGYILCGAEGTIQAFGDMLPDGMGGGDVSRILPTASGAIIQYKNQAAQYLVHPHPRLVSSDELRPVLNDATKCAVSRWRPATGGSCIVSGSQVYLLSDCGTICTSVYSLPDNHSDIDICYNAVGISVASTTAGLAYIPLEWPGEALSGYTYHGAVCATERAFAAVVSSPGGLHTVISWGDPAYGGDNASVKLKCFGARGLWATQSAFSAWSYVHGMITWGAGNTCPRRVSEALWAEHHTDTVPPTVVTTRGAFAALTRSGRVYAWGDTATGGELPTELYGPKAKAVASLRATDRAFLAVFTDGGVCAWGHPGYGGAVCREYLSDLHINGTVSGSTSTFAAIVRGHAHTGDHLVVWGAALPGRWEGVVHIKMTSPDCNPHVVTNIIAHDTSAEGSTRPSSRVSLSTIREEYDGDGGRRLSAPRADDLSVDYYSVDEGEPYAVSTDRKKDTTYPPPHANHRFPDPVSTEQIGSDAYTIPSGDDTSPNMAPLLARVTPILSRSEGPAATDPPHTVNNPVPTPAVANHVRGPTPTVANHVRDPTPTMANHVRHGSMGRGWGGNIMRELDMVDHPSIAEDTDDSMLQE